MKPLTSLMMHTFTGPHLLLAIQPLRQDLAPLLPAMVLLPQAMAPQPQAMVLLLQAMAPRPPATVLLPQVMAHPAMVLHPQAMVLHPQAMDLPPLVMVPPLQATVTLLLPLWLPPPSRWWSLIRTEDLEAWEEAWGSLLALLPLIACAAAATLAVLDALVIAGAVSVALCTPKCTLLMVVLEVWEEAMVLDMMEGWVGIR